MNFFDSLDRFVSDLEKSLKPEEVVRLKSCKNCPYYRKGYCTQTPVPTKILSEYWAQACIYYGAEQPVSGLMTTTEREDYKSLLDRIKKIDLVDLITKITTIQNITSIDLIDLINKINEITTIGTVQSIGGSVDPYSLASKTKLLDKLEFAYDESGDMDTIKGYEGENQTFTLTFTYDEAGSLTQIVRT